MKFAFPFAVGLALASMSVPAHAQMSPGSPGDGLGAIGGGPKLQPKGTGSDLAPAGLPGIGGPVPMATGPKLQKSNAGDPTVELFDAINANNYAAAQDALSRGASLQATDQFGETPLDLAIALNRTDITFMLLSTRNELAAQGESGGAVMGAPWTLDNSAKPAASGQPASRVVPVKATPRPEFSSGGTGTPDPQAGFLGFGPKS